jgi:DNA-binding beta-propeller fold protein YncE
MLAPPPPGKLAAGPFGVAVTAAGNWGFATSLPILIQLTVPAPAPGTASPPALPSASLPPAPVSGPVSAVDVLRLAPDHAAALVHRVTVPGPAAGAALSPNGRLLLVAEGAGAAVIRVRAAEQGSRQAELGTLAAPGSPAADGAAQVAIAPDGRFAFVSLQYAGEIAVFNLARAMAHGFSAAGVYVGSIPDHDAIGLTVSPDGRWLYATAGGTTSPAGTLSVISVRKAESDPAASVVARVPAGCTPVRVLTSAGGSVVWVTAIYSNALLAFSAARLQTDPAHALLADVHVGQAPAGLALAGAGKLIVVADSNRFTRGYPRSNLAVVDVADALAGKPALLGYLPAGRFPRDVAASANGSILLVANYSSGQVEEVDSGALP